MFFITAYIYTESFISWTVNVTHFSKAFVSALIERNVSSYLSKLSLSILFSYCSNCLVTAIIVLPENTLEVVWLYYTICIGRGSKS